MSAPPAAWKRREVQLRRHGDIWVVRRIGQVWLPDEPKDTEEEAMDRVNELIGPDWVEVPAYPVTSGR